MTDPIVPDEGESLMRDLARETWNSWTAMPLWSQAGFKFGIRAVAVLAATFLLGFVVAFARLRRRA